MRIATIVDVAKRAGVSIATVSRVINNSRIVSEQKRTRVLEVMQEIGYSPAVRENRNGKAILLLVSSGTNQMVEDVVTGITNAAEMTNSTPALAVSLVKQDADSYQQSLKLLKIMPRELLYGIIFLSNLCTNEFLWGEFQQYPLVQIGEYIDTSPLLAVTTDDVKAMKELTMLLINNGRKRLVLVSNRFGVRGQPYQFCLHREVGFRLALEEAGIAFNPDMLIYTDYTIEGSADAGRRIAEMKNRPDAVLCISDYIASSLIVELQAQGIAVPADIAVTGFDNDESSEICRPRLTTVHQSFEEMGAEAFFMLDALISGRLKVGRITYIQHSIIERDST
jgi:LacI family repressor for deo operon, udp, cdd, tsx, nupC, and nupG